MVKAVEPIMEAAGQIVQAIAEHYSWIDVGDGCLPSCAWQMRQARKRWRRRMMWERNR
jgi:hypothetical protein